MCSILKGLHACSCCWTWQDVHTFIGFTIRCGQSEKARCWLLRLMYRPVWCTHLHDIAIAWGIDNASIIKKALLDSIVSLFRLVGTKKIHKKAKSFVRRNLGGRSPSINIISYYNTIIRIYTRGGRRRPPTGVL